MQRSQLPIDLSYSGLAIHVLTFDVSFMAQWGLRNFFQKVLFFTLYI